MTNTAIQQTDDAGPTATFEKQLEAKVLQGLDLAIQNAIAAQQRLYVLGTAALAQALSKRVGSREESTKPDVNESESRSMEELASRVKEIVETHEASVEESGSPVNSASTTFRLMMAFAEVLDMLNAVNAQQMSNYIKVTLYSELEFGKDPGTISPIAARFWMDLLTNSQLAQVIGDLKAVSAAFDLPSAEHGSHDLAET